MANVKICGITDFDSLRSAIEFGAEFAGFVFYPPSPRALEISEAAELVGSMQRSIKAVGLFVNPQDTLLEDVLASVPLDFIQLHGSESPQRVRRIRAKFGLPVIKAISIGNQADIRKAYAYERVANWILFDSKPEALPGGMGLKFDWSLLENYRHTKPWMLAGGLNAENVGKAFASLSPDIVDVSSGVEDRPGQKSPQKIQEFIETVHNTV